MFATGFGQRDDALFTPVPAPLRQMPGAAVRIARWPRVTAEAHDPRHRNFWGDYCFDLDGLRAFSLRRGLAATPTPIPAGQRLHMLSLPLTTR